MVGFLMTLGAVLLVAALIGAFYDWLYPEERVSDRERWVSTRWHQPKGGKR